MFEAGMRELDEVTMNELGQLLWSDDSLGLGSNTSIDGGWNVHESSRI